MRSSCAVRSSSHNVGRVTLREARVLMSQGELDNGEDELLLPAPASSLSPPPPLEDDTAAFGSSAEDSADHLTTETADTQSDAPTDDTQGAERTSGDDLLAAAPPTPHLDRSAVTEQPHANADDTSASDAMFDTPTTHPPLPIEPQQQEERQTGLSSSLSLEGLLDSTAVSTTASASIGSALGDVMDQEPQQSSLAAQSAASPSAVSTSLGSAPTGSAASPRAERRSSIGSSGRMHPRSPSSEEWHSILLSKQQTQLAVKAIQSLPTPPLPNDRKRRRGKQQRDDTQPATQLTAAEDEDDEDMSVAARLRGRRAKRDAQEEKGRDDKADDASVEDDEPVVQQPHALSSSRAELRALLESDDLSAPSLSSSSLLLSSLDSFSSSFHATLTQLTSSLNSQIEQHTQSLHTDWQSQWQGAQSTQHDAIAQAVEVEATRWQDVSHQWAAECRRVRGELDGLRDVQSQLHSLLSSHPALAADEKADGEDKMELFIQYYREKERGMRDKDKKLNTREQQLKEREDKAEVRVLYVTQEKKREVDDMRDKATRMRNEWEVERSKSVRERKELREKVEEMKLDRLMRESEVAKLKLRVKELTDAMAVVETRTKGGGGGGGGGGLVVKEEKRRVEVDVGERERREKQDKYVADIEEYLRRQSAELKELRAAEAASREEARRREEEAGLDKRRAELEERKRVEAEARWSEAEKQRSELSRQLVASQAERDSMAERLRVAQARQPPPPLLPSPPQPHAAPVTHMVHPSRAAAVVGYTAQPAPNAPAAHTSSGGQLEADNVALVRDMILKLEQEKKARERQAAIERDERDRHERDRLARIEAEQRVARERVEALEREREQREQIEREELQRLAMAEARSPAMAGGGWKSVKVNTLTQPAQPPLLPTPAVAVSGMMAAGGSGVIAGQGHTGRVCSFFNSARGCRKGEHCDHLHVPGNRGAAGAAVGLAAALAGKRDDKEEGELDELPMLVR